ncbi:pentatricopeptide repeat-containing protein-like [Dorcoceras hygrometricum]|uniref:Pentatricopeptide repeat-containing protein-like n=1 Tax=Dorcoceras hygrometricum TaxID=472368 RepID=A0A2Z7D916_9LAMI|nr:pentatricopeptide repeat-containing protein-like [Dorcoceras hygrometricum]
MGNMLHTRIEPMKPGKVLPHHPKSYQLACAPEVMPTVIVFEYDGEWKSNNDEIPIFKWCSRSGCKWAAIPVDDEICSAEYIQTEIYKIMGLDGIERLRRSYVSDVRHCHMPPIYIENDNDLKAYLYFGCP